MSNLKYQKKTKQYTDTLLADNEFKFVSVNEDTGEQVLNLNIDMGRLSCVRSFAENLNFHTYTMHMHMSMCMYM